MKDFLPVSVSDMKKRGWDYYDFLYITGDAYVDHPSFGHAIISRILEDAGYRVCILPLPDWRSKDDFLQFGKPRLGVLVTAGNIDSMVNHYTVSKKRRSDDAYAPGNRAGQRPDRATIVYCNRVREAFGDVPLLIGGVEASLRRFAHYDYWDDKVRRSMLIDSRADILMYGMGEKQIVRIANLLEKGVPVKKIRDIPGTCYLSSECPGNVLEIPSFDECRDDKKAYAKACIMQYNEQNPYLGEVIAQRHHDKYLVQNPPMPPLNTDELDHTFSLPYMKNYHPMYEAQGGIEAIREVKFSLAANRGCYGGCNFCALAFHQGRIVTSRSEKSLIAEAVEMTKDPDFKGYIHDVGGPTANFTGVACDNQTKYGACKNKECLFPSVCKNMKVDHKKYLSILRKLRDIQGVKKVFIRSGIRFDYLIADKDDTFFKELCEHHVSGQLKVAPEHVSDNVLMHMGKPKNSVYNRFSDKFYDTCKKLGKKQYLVPYLMSSHPGSTIDDAIELALYLKKHNINPQQVQDFYPTPGTISTCMFYTGINPYTMEKVYVSKSYKEKAMQRALLQFKNPANYQLVYDALTMAGRQDLIGFGEGCLIPPRKIQKRRTENGKDFKRQGSFTKNKERAKARGRGTKRKRH